MTERSVKEEGTQGGRLDHALRELASADVLYNAAVASRLGISPTDLRCLSHLDAEGWSTAGDLARRSGLTSGAITGVIDRLVAARLAQREPDSADARRVRVVPVAGRRAEVERLMRPLGERLVRLTETMSDAERQGLHRFVEAARHEMEAETHRVRAASR